LVTGPGRSKLRAGNAGASTAIPRAVRRIAIDSSYFAPHFNGLRSEDHYL
jgi:hypothetical protein